LIDYQFKAKPPKSLKYSKGAMKSTKSFTFSFSAYNNRLKNIKFYKGKKMKPTPQK
jgi:hypothetical protein